MLKLKIIIPKKYLHSLSFQIIKKLEKTHFSFLSPPLKIGLVFLTYFIHISLRVFFSLSEYIVLGKGMIVNSPIIDFFRVNNPSLGS